MELSRFLLHSRIKIQESFDIHNVCAEQKQQHKVNLLTFQTVLIVMFQHVFLRKHGCICILQWITDVSHKLINILQITFQTVSNSQSLLRVKNIMLDVNIDLEKMPVFIKENIFISELAATLK